MKCERISGPIFREREYVRFKPHWAWLLPYVVNLNKQNISKNLFILWKNEWIQNGYEKQIESIWVAS